jgi:actin-related protein 5
MHKMKERGRRKAALADRKSAAAQARMKNIASLAADDRVPKKKRKAGAGAFRVRPAGMLKSQCNWHCIEDTFGADDEDWAIYRKIVMHSA